MNKIDELERRIERYKSQLNLWENRFHILSMNENFEICIIYVAIQTNMYILCTLYLSTVSQQVTSNFTLNRLLVFSY